MKFFKILGFLSNSIFSLIFFLVTVLLIYKFTFASYTTSRDYFGNENSKDKNIEVFIKDEYNLSDVAKELENKGVIKSKYIFQMDSYLFGAKDMDFNEGNYTLNSSMDSREIRDTLRQPSNLGANDIRVTLKEGLTLKEIAEILEDKGVTTSEKFLNACSTETFDYYFLNNLPERENKLEGYLFPDTYFFIKDMEPNKIINKMLARFNEIYSEEYIMRTEEMGLTIDQVIKIASIIEKEVRKSDERPKVSSVIYNRLNSDMKLQMCSTVLYVLEKRKDRLLDEDLKVTSPYNTYENVGLPEGPISNPGEECIKAALYPEDTDYLYFVIKNENTGEHFFTSDYDEFLNAKQEYNQKF